MPWEKSTPEKEIKLQKTPRDDTEHGKGEADTQGTGVNKNTTPTIKERKETGPPVDAGRGGSGERMMETGRGRKGQ